MIITEKFPQKSLYFLGAKLLEYITKENIKFTLLELYESFSKQYKIEFKRFVLILDWLFLIDSIKTTEDGFIIKCS